VGAVRDVSVGRKLYGSFGIVVALLLGVLAVGVWGGSSISSKTHSVAALGHALSDAGQVKYQGADMNGWETAYAFDVVRGVKGAASDSGASRHAFLQSAAALRHAFAALSRDSLNAGERAQLRRAESDFARFMGTDNRVIGLYRKGTPAAANAATALVLGREITLYDALSKNVDRLDAQMVRRADAADSSASSTASLAQTVMLLAGLLAVLLAGAVAFLLARYVKSVLLPLMQRLESLSCHCLTDLGRGLAAMARGDLTVPAEPVTEPIANPSRDEFGRLAVTFNAMLATAQGGLESYNATRAQLAGMIGEIANSSTSLSAASEEMAATSEETGRAVGEIASAITEVAEGATRQVAMVDHARNAAEETARAAGEAREVAEEGVAAAEQASNAMTLVRDASSQVSDAIGSLAAKSEQIGGIVETITGIADQTNLLALNAAIEAARAGEQGRGFAVVAEEVRKLAEESQQAAATIGGLISEIQAETGRTVDVVADGAQKSADGAAVVDQAREAFAEIGSSTSDIATRVAQIADAAGEIASVAEQSSAATQEVSASTEQTSASTQEIAASAQELARTAEHLQGLIGRFTLN
jgi:methyl-accepting chemotaxis protein